MVKTPEIYIPAQHTIYMGIPLAQLLGNTPDALKSVNGDRDVPTSTMENKYVWYLRNTEKPGLNVKLDPSKKGDRWLVEIYDVEWNGDEFVEKPQRRSYCGQNRFQDAVSYANQMVKKACRNDDELSYLISST